MVPDPKGFGRESAPKGRKRRVGLSRQEENRLKARLRRTTPSEPWVEAQIKSVTDRDGAGGPIEYRYHDPHVFPPGGEKTLMVRCACCTIFNPPNAMEQGKCLDHSEQGGWGPSPSAEAIRALQRYNLRLAPFVELEPEDTAALRREISEYFRKSPASRARKNSSKSL